MNWLLVDKVINIFGGLAVTIIVIRYLGPEKFGLFGFVAAFISFFAVFSGLGLRNIVVRELNRNDINENDIMGASFLLQIIGSIIAFIVIAISINFYKSDSYTQELVIVAGTTYLFQIFNGINFFYSAKILSKYTVIAKNISFVVSSTIKILFVKYNFSLIYFVMVSLFDGFLASVVIVYIYKKQGYKLTDWNYKLVIIKKLLTYSWPLAVATFLTTIYLKVDQVMIEYYLSLNELGLYSVAVRMVEYLYFVPSILVNTLMPYFVKLREKNKIEYYNKLLRLYSIMFWSGVFVGLITFLFGETVIIIVFGEEYRASYVPLMINIWCFAIVGQSLASGIWNIAEDLQSYRVYVNILFIFTNISFNIVLIPRYGISGAAIASLLSLAFSTWLYPLIFGKLRQNTIELVKSINPIHLLRR